MKTNQWVRWGATGLLVVAAIVCVWVQYRTYFNNPWTRDGLVQAQVVQVAARVSGPVGDIHVADNAFVRAGTLLFEMEDSVYRALWHQAEANLEQKLALLDVASRNSVLQQKGRTTLFREKGQHQDDAVAEARAAVKVAQAQAEEAQAQAEEARLNVAFTKVYAPVDGYITNLSLQPGSMAVAYKPLFALINAESFWIDAFFRETVIGDIAPGDTALVTLMSYPDTPLEGKVGSIGRGIARVNGSTGEKLLPTVSPTFEWIRLPQRIPVRIELGKLPENIQLRMGTTASVLIRVKPGGAVLALPSFLQ